MVYCGRPSASCALCRSKKKRCDKATPSCGQCRRAGLDCPGYHDQSSIIIRDETKRVIKRARARKAHSLPLESPNASSKGWPSPGSTNKSGSPSATTTTYVLRSGNAHQDGKPARLPETGCAQDEQNDELDNLIDAVHGNAANANDLDFFLASMEQSPGSDWLVPISASSPSASDLDMQMSIFKSSPPAPSESLHDLGVNYFLTNYVMENSGPCPGFFNYTLDILGAAECDTLLAEAAIRAVGLAGLAGSSPSGDGSNAIMRRARTSYGEAIERVHAAFADPDRARSDTTVFAVLVLGLFETITCSNRASVDAWGEHINGAAALLVRRGSAQFRTKLGQHLFGESFSHVLTLCTIFGHAIPPRLRMLRLEMGRRASSNREIERKDAASQGVMDPPLPKNLGLSWAVSSAHIDVMDLFQRVDVDRSTAFLENDWENLLVRALEIDQRLENLTTKDQMPSSWQYKTVNDPSASRRVVYRGTYHLYHDPWVAKVWDGVRSCRIILLQAMYCLLVREGMAWAPEEVSPRGGGTYAYLEQKISDTTEEMRDGILASVPQMLGFVHYDATLGTSYLNCSSDDMQFLAPASGAYFLLWYLFLAGCLPMNPPEMRAWIVDRLRAIRLATGIQQATYLADTLESDVFSTGSVLTVNDFLIPDF